MDSSDSVPTAGPARQAKLCIVAPCFNEESSLRAFYTELKRALSQLPDCTHEILFVDDGSTDATPDLLDELVLGDPAVRMLSLSRNFGHQIALTAGLDAADGDAVIMMDADLQHPPALIPEMVARWKEGADIVSTVRRATQGVSLLKREASHVFYSVINLLSDTYVVPGAADFCLLSRRAHRALSSVRERQRFLRGIVSWIGFNRTLIPFESPPRFAGRSRYGVAQMVRLATSAVVSFSVWPLRLATRLGLLISAAGFLYLLYVLIAKVFFNATVEGWASLMSVVLILSGVQLVFTGLLGQYLAVVYEESKRRPLYFVKRSSQASAPSEESEHCR